MCFVSTLSGMQFVIHGENYIENVCERLGKAESVDDIDSVLKELLQQEPFAHHAIANAFAFAAMQCLQFNDTQKAIEYAWSGTRHKHLFFFFHFFFLCRWCALALTKHRDCLLLAPLDFNLTEVNVTTPRAPIDEEDALWQAALPLLAQCAPIARFVFHYSGLLSEFPLLLSLRDLRPCWSIFVSIPDQCNVRVRSTDEALAVAARWFEKNPQKGKAPVMRTPLLPGVTWRPLAVPLPWSADCSAPSELALEAGEQLCVVSPWHEDNASVVMVLNAGASEWQTTIVKSHFRVLLASAREMLNRESDNVHERLERNAEIAFACLNRHTGVKARRDEARSVELLERFLSSRGEDDNDGKRGAQRVR
jgi:hypothetical protein